MMSTITPGWILYPFPRSQPAFAPDHFPLQCKRRGRELLTRVKSPRPFFNMKQSSCNSPSENASATKVNIWSGDQINPENLIERVKFNNDGLVAAIAQQYDTNEVLMMAWMNTESIRETMRQGRAVYYSRSRKTLWRKGDTSGQEQYIHDVLLDCDGDTVLLKVDQIGVACHTGRKSCFYTAFRPPQGTAQIVADVLVDPNEMYGSK